MPELKQTQTPVIRKQADDEIIGALMVLSGFEVSVWVHESGAFRGMCGGVKNEMLRLVTKESKEIWIRVSSITVIEEE